MHAYLELKNLKSRTLIQKLLSDTRKIQEIVEILFSWSKALGKGWWSNDFSYHRGKLTMGWNACDRLLIRNTFRFAGWELERGSANNLILGPVSYTNWSFLYCSLQEIKRSWVGRPQGACGSLLHWAGTSSEAELPLCTPHTVITVIFTSMIEMMAIFHTLKQLSWVLKQRV